MTKQDPQKPELKPASGTATADTPKVFVQKPEPKLPEHIAPAPKPAPAAPKPAPAAPKPAPAAPKPKPTPAPPAALPEHIAPAPKPAGPNAFSATAVNAAREPSLPSTSEPTVDGLTGMQWCKKHGLTFQFDLPAIRVLNKTGEILGMAYNANSAQGLVEAIQAVKKNPGFAKS